MTSQSTSWIPLFVAAFFVAAAAAPWLNRVLRSAGAAVLALVPFAGVVLFARFLPLEPGVVHQGAIPWVPQLGVELAWAVDGLFR